MKKLIQIALLAVFLVAGSQTFAQVFKGQVIGGFTTSHITGDRMLGFSTFGPYKTGYTLGLGVVAPLTDKLDLSLETNFTTKGAKDIKQGTRKISLRYLEAPLVLLYEIDRDIYAGAGVYYGQLISSQETEGNFIYTDQVYLDKGIFKGSDIGALFDLRFPVYKSMNLNLRYSASVLPIRTSVFKTTKTGNDVPTTEKQFNHALSLRVIWVFNEKKGKKKGPKVDDFQ